MDEEKASIPTSPATSRGSSSPRESHEQPQPSGYEDITLSRPKTNASIKSYTSIASRTISALSDPTTHIVDPGPPPDGGAVAWTQAFMGHLVICSTWGYISSYGVFQTYYLSTISTSGSALAWIGSLQIFLMFAVSTFTGRALDAGYFRLVFGTGCILQLLGIFMTSLCKTYWQLLLAQGICTGLGNGLQFCPTVGLVSTYFSTRKSTAIAISAAGSATGGIVFPVIVQQLLPRVGFGWTVRVVAFVIMALDATTFSLLRTRLPPRRSGPLVEWAALREGTYVLFVLGLFFCFWALYFAFYYVGLFARTEVGLSYSQSINLLIIMNGVGMVGRLLPGWIADRYTGPLNSLIPVSAVCALMLYCWAAVSSSAGLYVFSCVYGLFAAGIQSLWPATLTSLTTDLKKVGTRTGMGFSVVSIATLTGSPLGGALVQAMHGSYLGAQVWAGTSFVIGAALMLWARCWQSGAVFKYRI